MQAIVSKNELMGAKFYKLFELLMRRGISQKELAAAIGAQEGTITALKRKPDQDFKISTLIKICQYLNCSMDDIMDIEDDEPGQNKSAEAHPKKETPSA